MEIVAGALVAVVVVLGLALLYGRAKEGKGRAAEQAEDAQADREALDRFHRAREASRHRDRADRLRRMRERAARRRAGPTPSDE